MHPRWHRRQGRAVSGRPARDFGMISWSVRYIRAAHTMSAAPEAMTCSASSKVEKLPTTATGMCSRSFTFRAQSTLSSRGRR